MTIESLLSPEVWGIVAGVLLTAGTGVFVASEFALVNLDRADLERRQAAGERRLSATIGALRVTSTHLSSAQLGITLTTLLAGYTFEPALSSLISEPLRGWGVPSALVGTIGAVGAVTLATLFSMIFGELVPKNFALAVPLATARVVVPLQVAFTWLFKPVVLLLNGTANRVIRRFGVEPKEELSGARSAEELTYLVRRSAAEGTLDREEAEILHRSLRFSERTAAEVMTPRVRMASLPRASTASDVVAASLATGHSRFPVLGDGVDDVIGIVHVKRAYAVDFSQRRTTPVSRLLGEPLRVPDTARVGALLSALRGRGYQIAVVVDEHGGTAGILTLEDLVEELLGEVHDEHDRAVPDVEQHGSSVTLRADLRPDEAWERARVWVPSGDEYDTIAGYVLETLGRIPGPGDEARLERGTLRVERVDGLRIERLRYLPDAPDTDPATAGPVDAAPDRSEGTR